MRVKIKCEAEDRAKGENKMHDGREINSEGEIK